MLLKLDCNLFQSASVTLLERYLSYYHISMTYVLSINSYDFLSQHFKVVAKNLTVNKDEQALTDLVQAAASGSHDSFEALCHYCLPLVSREVKKYVRPEDLDDVVQECLIKLYHSLKNYKETGLFKAWLRKLVTRSCIDFWRKIQRQQRTKDAYQHENPVAQVELQGDVLLRSQLDQCLAELSAEERILCTMVFIEQLSHKEAAEILDCTVISVKVRCFRLKSKLQRRIAL